jgi:hypothetical protein
MASAGEHVVRRRREERERERESEKGAQGAAPTAGDAVAVGSPKSFGGFCKTRLLCRSDILDGGLISKT